MGQRTTTIYTDDLTGVDVRHTDQHIVSMDGLPIKLDLTGQTMDALWALLGQSNPAPLFRLYGANNYWSGKGSGHDKKNYASTEYRKTQENYIPEPPAS